MSKNLIDTMGLRELTATEMAYLQTTKNYQGGLILAFISMDKDAAALDTADAVTADRLVGKLRKTISGAQLSRCLQTYTTGCAVILARVQYGEKIVLTDKQEEALH